MERKEYLSPVVKVICLEAEKPLASGSQSGGEDPWDAKGQNFYFDDWDDEEDLTLPKSKSLWEDD